MRKNVVTLLIGSLILLGIFTTEPVAFGADSAKVLYNFCNDRDCLDGSQGTGGLIFDANGNLYGTTSAGGPNGYGTVFRLSPGANGKWTNTILYRFKYKDGIYPQAGVIFDKAGNLYGTTLEGGMGKCLDSLGNLVGCGTVFELMPQANGEWTEKVLHNFNIDGRDGLWPQASLIFDSSGNLYGTTRFGGKTMMCEAPGCGTVFELTPRGNGDWAEIVLHSFSDGGHFVSSGVVFDSAGNLYGTTSSGGPDGGGVVFRLTRDANGYWQSKMIYPFGINVGVPSGNLIFDAAGNLYGTLFQGGTQGGGAVFELTMDSGEKWTKKILYSFPGPNSGYGANPLTGVVFDASGNLYGTTSSGGNCGVGYSGCGVVFELKAVNGKWNYRFLFAFNGKNGEEPMGPPVLDSAGNIYGSTSGGGRNADGTIFRVVP